MAGWKPVPGGKHGGMRRKVGGKWQSEPDSLGLVRGSPPDAMIAEFGNRVGSIEYSEPAPLAPGFQGGLFKGAYRGKGRRVGTPGNYRYIYDEPSTSGDRAAATATTQRRAAGEGLRGLKSWDDLKTVRGGKELDDMPVGSEVLLMEMHSGYQQGKRVTRGIIYTKGKDSWTPTGVLKELGDDGIKRFRPNERQRRNAKTQTAPGDSPYDSRSWYESLRYSLVRKL